MSTLTKVLIVLLTVASIFLCGVVVTYVASANNYKEMWEGRRDSEVRANRRAENAANELNEAKDLYEAGKTKLNSDIATLQAQITNLNNQLTDAITARNEARQRKENYPGLRVSTS